MGLVHTYYIFKYTFMHLHIYYIFTFTYILYIIHIICGWAVARAVERWPGLMRRVHHVAAVLMPHLALKYK